MPSKKPLVSRPAASGRPSADTPKDVASARIAEHLAAFAASGGIIEVLGVTRVLKHLDDAAPAATSNASTP